MAEAPLQSAPPVLSVVVGTKNRLPQLTCLLESLVGHIDTPHEILVVDAGSTDGTREYVRTVRGVRLIDDLVPRGQAQDLNTVFRTLASDFVCWLSDDNIARPGMLDTAARILREHADIGMVGLKVRDISGPHAKEPYIGGIWPTGVLNVNQGMIRRSVLHGVGYFDEAFRDYGVDPDLTTKVLVAGLKVVFTKDVAILHDRDHNAAPGAIQNDQRAARLKLAKALYAYKYAPLMTTPEQRTTRERLFTAIWRAQQVAGKLRVDGESTATGLVARDWHNLIRARHVHPLDFWRRRGESFYLMQHIADRSHGLTPRNLTPDEVESVRRKLDALAAPHAEATAAAAGAA